MAGIDIQAKVKKGLARAIVKTSSASADLVYKIERTSNGGTPMNPIAPTEASILLVDAIFKSYHDTQIDQTLILSGDRQLVTNGDVLIEPNDIIQIGIERFIVQPSVDVKNPSGVPLAYTAQVRPTGNYIAPPLAVSTMTAGSLFAVSGNADDSGYYAAEGVGSLSPPVVIGGFTVDGLYFRDVGGGNYEAVIFSSGEMYSGNMTIIVGGVTGIYVQSGNSYIYSGLTLPEYNQMTALIGVPTTVTIYGN